MFKKNNRAAIGAAMTWVVATIIILLIMIIFVYLANILGSGGVFKGSLKINDEYFPENFAVGSEQMLLAVLETELNDKKVKEIIGGEDFELSNEIEKNELNNFLKTIPDYVFYVNEVGVVGWKEYVDFAEFNLDVFKDGKHISKFGPATGFMGRNYMRRAEVYLGVDNNVRLSLENLNLHKL